MNKKYLFVFVFLFPLLFIRIGGAVAMELTSTSFEPGKNIPSEYTCDGANISPDLKWQNLPSGTKSLVVIMDDPDAPSGMWDHWLVFNIPPASKGLPEGGPMPSSSSIGKNSWGTTEYRGPCPPDKMHRYFFRLYALNNLLNLKTGSSKADIKNAMQGHVLENTELMATYERSH